MRLMPSLSSLHRGAVASGVQHVKYWIDTEFIARPYTIDLISIGLVAEDGREFYAESSEVDWSKASLWTLQNVRPQLDGKGMGRVDIGYAVRKFTRWRRASGVLGLFSRLRLGGVQLVVRAHG
jgi:hypothetical protein